MAIPVIIYNEDNKLIFTGGVNDNEANELTKDKRFNLEIKNNTLVVYIVGDK